MYDPALQVPWDPLAPLITLRGDFSSVTTVDATFDGVPVPVLVSATEVTAGPVAGGADLMISFDTPRQSEIHVRLYDVRGREVAGFVEGSYGAGTHVARLPTSKKKCSPSAWKALALS